MQLDGCVRVRRACFLVALLVSANARADRWVDVVNGNDANPGTSPGAAFATITHAIAASSAGTTIHVAPGVYSGASGELFPLQPRRNQKIIGDFGADVTVVQGSGYVFMYFVSSFGDPSPISPATELVGLTLDGGSIGVEVSTNWSAAQPTLRDLVIRNMSIGGIDCGSSSPAGASAAPLIRRTRISNCAKGALLSAGVISGPPATCAPVFEDCVIEASTTFGISASAQRGTVLPTLRRCRVLQSGDVGLRLSGGIQGTARGTVEDSIVARGLSDGLELASTSGAASIVLTRCTIASNAGIGVRITGAVPPSTIDSTIVFGNLGGDSVSNPSSSLIGVDPRFVDAALGDFRLRWGSPAIDQGGSPGALDVFGFERHVDGDLDLSHQSDIGAIEFRPLQLRGTPELGQRIGIERWGAAGKSSTLFVSPLPLVAAQSTPFGDLHLDGGLTSAASTVVIGPRNTHVLNWLLPDDPGLVGTTLSYQALTSSPASPSGAAYSNPVTFVIGP